MSVKVLGRQERIVDKPIIQGKKFDAIFFVLVAWFVLGTFCDAWAHSNIPRLETFFTPWHGILYSGVMFLVFALTAVLIMNRRRGASWDEVLPKGYFLSLVGIYLMVLAGLGDMTWHILFGVEQNIDAVFSPTHIFAMVCIGLVAAGPLRAMYYRRGNPTTWQGHLLLVGAFILPFALLSNVSQPASLFTQMWPDTYAAGQDDGQLLAVVSFILQALLFAGLALYFVKRWTLKPGFFTLVLTVTALALSTMRQFWFMIPVYFIAGALIDLVYWRLKPSTTRKLEFRIFSAVAAAAPSAIYILYAVIFTPTVWSIHLLAGSVFVVTIIGVFFSYLALPEVDPDLLK